MKKKQEKKKKAEVDKSLNLKLTIDELKHLRDIMSVSLPPDKNLTVSMSLALMQKREKSEESLWNKVCYLCETNGVVLGAEAPDFIVSITNVPPMGVFEVETEK
jgi:hypothetical protein